ncbi:DUF808 domain-containing protein [Corynebacterium sp. TAE3-ERU12]|uniref:DUF808 domain-containing protein n=1 Tax=Corynebacterium sp. TAE3-ERU12 TaxID=2849491 RepID=UPI001C46D8A1|nr:DUF808 domain-containing protein [Corynebacterium sp. TAE3-ERU12]MBV7295743.1 DUF808 domain-containing protein [Corynebacterium sp. TAE3-ERU12]
MSAGLAALLDDVALIARSAAASVDDVSAAAARVSTKAAGVVVDDAAVTPRYVAGVSPKRELPIIWRITKGSLFNKIVIILPLALLLSSFAPWLLTPILMLGGCYLCYEGAEKILEKLTGNTHDEPVAQSGGNSEDKLVKAAITTDLILSAEIMVISLNEVTNEPLLQRTIILLIVAVAITALVYGAVGLLVKIDDIGLRLGQSDSAAVRKTGVFMVKGMPKLLTAISVIGVLAMLWVGGHILIAGVHTLGWHTPHDILHHLAGLSDVAAISWLIDTASSMLVGLVVGAIIVGVFHFLPLPGKKQH